MRRRLCRCLPTRPIGDMLSPWQESRRSAERSCAGYIRLYAIQLLPAKFYAALRRRKLVKLWINQYDHPEGGAIRCRRD